MTFALTITLLASPFPQQAPAYLTKVDGIQALRIGSHTILANGTLMRVGQGFVIQDYGMGKARIFKNGALVGNLDLYRIKRPSTGIKPPLNEGLSASVYPELTETLPLQQGSSLAIVSFRASEIMGEPTEYQVLVRINPAKATLDWVRLLRSSRNPERENQRKNPERFFRTRSGDFLLESDTFWKLNADGTNGKSWMTCPKNGEIVGFANRRYVLLDRDGPRTKIDALDLLTKQVKTVFNDSRSDKTSWIVAGSSAESDYFCLQTGSSPPAFAYRVVHLTDGKTYPGRVAADPVGPYLLELWADHAQIFDIKSGRLLQRVVIPGTKTP